MEAVQSAASADTADSTFLGRHQFLIYRLFSLAGLIPIGAYVVVHLAVNASILAGPGAYQAQVDRIHSLGPFLVTVAEWVFIFIPILFHAAVGFWIIAGGLPNVATYPYGSNVRYTLQRATGMIAIAFILFHLWQMHHLGKALGGGNFDPERAASSAGLVLHSFLMQIIYAIGTLAAVYHLSNGIWTFGITWGIWTSDAAQRRVGYVCAAFGILLGAVGLGAIYGMATVNVSHAQVVEQRIEHNRELLEGKIPGPDASGPASNSMNQLQGEYAAWQSNGYSWLAAGWLGWQRR